jgi:hypothetical protein
MDTRFWGPSGWRLLHITSFQAPELPTNHLISFFKNLPFVLPCKFCRASLTDYYAADPIPEDPADYARWLYRIHNRVNGKLRDQKLLDTPDPAWDEIRGRYMEWVRAPCTKRRMVGWDFLFSVAYTTPSNRVATAPMVGAPPVDVLKTPELLNRWGMLKREARIPYFESWWSSLVHVLPFPEWRAAWKKALDANGSAPVRKGRQAVTAWLFKMEKAVCKLLNEAQPHDSFEGLCSELSTFSSGCGKASKRVKTCRATKKRARYTLKSRRRNTYKATGGFL